MNYNKIIDRTLVGSAVIAASLYFSGLYYACYRTDGLLKKVESSFGQVDNEINDVRRLRSRLEQVVGSVDSGRVSPDEGIKALNEYILALRTLDERVKRGKMGEKLLK